MSPQQPVLRDKLLTLDVLGLMSGTSLDGVDIVRLTTDGHAAGTLKGSFYWPYPEDLREQLTHAAQYDLPLLDLLRLENNLTKTYAQALLASQLLPGTQLVGCHGQTIRHLPSEGLTCQLGNPSLLAEQLAQAGHAVPVVMDFRRRDLAAGGEGAPLAPLFHQAMLHGQPLPAAVLNIGGVANVTVCLPDGQLVGSDCGPGMGLLDQFMQHTFQQAFDIEGCLSLKGVPDLVVIEKFLQEIPFFQRPLPRSADRYDFNIVLNWLQGATPEDTAATLTAITVAGIKHTIDQMLPANQNLQAIFICGGGGKNQAVWQGLLAAGLPVQPSTAIGWHPQHIEAACFAWLAARRVRQLPTSHPGATHARWATVGGVVAN